MLDGSWGLGFRDQEPKGVSLPRSWTEHVRVPALQGVLAGVQSTERSKPASARLLKLTVAGNDAPETRSAKHNSEE